MSEECKYCKTSQTCLETADYGSFYCLLHREIPRVIEKTYEELQQENQELKEQLSNSHQIKNKQKEFIEWLENYIDALIQQKETIAELDITEVHILMTLEEVLSKYKEIIGKDINVATKKDVK